MIKFTSSSTSISLQSLLNNYRVCRIVVPCADYLRSSRVRQSISQICFAFLSNCIIPSQTHSEISLSSTHVLYFQFTTGYAASRACSSALLPSKCLHTNWFNFIRFVMSPPRTPSVAWRVACVAIVDCWISSVSLAVVVVVAVVA